MTAPIRIVNLLTTFVIATRPMFWLKEVIGRHPNTEDRALTKPSQAMDPAVSFWAASRPRQVEARAEVSPMVSVAETRKIRKTETIAPG